MKLLDPDDIDPEYSIEQATQELQDRVEEADRKETTKADVVRRELGLGQGGIFLWESDPIPEAADSWLAGSDSHAFGLNKVLSNRNYDRGIRVCHPDQSPHDQGDGVDIGEFTSYERMYRDFQRGTLVPVREEITRLAEYPNGQEVEV
jgi:hypothetical protein